MDKLHSKNNSYKQSIIGAYIIFICVFVSCGVMYFSNTLKDKTKILDFDIDKRIDFTLPSSFNPNNYVSTKSLIGNRYMLAFIDPNMNNKDIDYHYFSKLSNWGINIYAVSTVNIEQKDNIFRDIAFDNKALVSEKMLLVGAPETFLIDEYGRIEKHYRGHINQQIIEEEILPFFKSSTYLAHS